MLLWIDTHCHLDAPEFTADLPAVRARARQAGVGLCVWPAVRAADFERVRALATAHGDAYALGIHPLFTPHATEQDLQALEQALNQAQGDPHLPGLVYEPQSALVSGPQGLDDLQAIIGQAPSYLKPQGWLLLEHGYNQATAVCDLLRQKGFTQVQSRNDLAGIARCSGGMRAEVK